MAVKYLSGNRLWGTDAERTDMTAFPSSIPATSWKQLDKDDWESGAYLECTGFAEKDNLLVIYNNTAGNDNGYLWLGDGGSVDTGSNYSWIGARGSNALSSDASDTSIKIIDSNNRNQNCGWIFIKNTDGLKKVVTSNAMESGGSNSSSAPLNQVWRGTWNDTAVADSIKIGGGGGTDMASGSQMIVLGCDNDEADSGTPFFQELVDYVYDGSATSTVTTPQFANKQYLWAEILGVPDGAYNIQLRFATTDATIDDGAYYANAFADDGGSWNETASNTYGRALMEEEDELGYVSMMAINVTGFPKMYWARGLNAGSSSTDIGGTRESYSKWYETASDVMRKIQLVSVGSAYLGAGTRIRVWGADPT